MLELNDQSFYDLFDSYQRSPNDFNSQELLFNLITAKISFQDSFIYNNDFTILIYHLIDQMPQSVSSLVLIKAFLSAHEQKRKFNLQQFNWFNVNSTQDVFSIHSRYSKQEVQVICSVVLDFLVDQMDNYPLRSCFNLK